MEETQVEPTSTPDEAETFPQTRTTEVLGKSEPLGDFVEGTMRAGTFVPEEYVAAEASEVEAEVETQSTVDRIRDMRDPVQDMSDWDMTRPPFILSFVESDHPNGGFVIGWDTCGACGLHIRTCTCLHGPAQPRYVKMWRPKADTKHDKPATLGREAKKAVVTADPKVVEEAVGEVLQDEERHPSGRKRRADAGKPRGPRTKGTPDSVLEAAGDLSAAMSKE